MIFSSHVVSCADRLLILSTQCLFMMVVVEDLLSLFPTCFFEDKPVRKNLIGQITLYDLKRDPYVKHSFFSETQKF